MTEKETPVTAQSKGSAKAEPATEEVSTVDASPPDRPGEEYRREWADANGVDPSEMREIRAVGGWVDRFDGRGWVQGS